MEKLGGIKLGGAFGGYDIVNKPCDKLPQDVASAVASVNGGLLGATFSPIWYIGKQTVNGVNHFFIAEEIRVTKTQDAHIVGLVINIPPGEGAAKGEGAKVVRIIEEAELPEEAQVAFDTATKQLLGVAYKPVAYVGSQVVRGVNHYIICEAKTIYPGSTPFAAVMCLNVFEGKVSVIGIAPLPNKSDGESGLCGYAFTW
ncbi:MAG: hypothetical protein IJ709_10750 [Selenomonas sp.]|nr:hypothetical protein [Selenomonas sp.]